MASSSKGKASRKTIGLSDEELLRGNQNTRVQIIPANDPDNHANTPLQVFCDSEEKILNDHSIIVCEYEGTWHQVIFPEGKAILKQPAEFIHQYDIPNEATEEPVAELATLLDQKARISPASQPIPLHTPTTPTTTQKPSMTTTTTKATTSTPTTTTTTAATTTTPDDIKKKFDKALRRNNPGSGGGEGGGGGGGGGGAGGNAPQPQQVILPGQDERIMGQLPQVFDGDRTKVKAFMEEVKGYIRLNTNVNGLNSPMKKVSFVLTLVKGDDVRSWVEDMGRVIDRLDPLVDNIPEVWDHFCAEFATQFLDTAEQETARSELQKLHMEPGKIDQYISKFEELARRAHYTVGNEETARLFLEGLTTQVMQDDLTTDGLNGYEDYKRRAIDASRNRSILSQILQSRDHRQKGGHPRYSLGPQTYQQRNPFFYRGNNPNYAKQTPQYNTSNAPPSMNDQPVAMDLSRSNTNWRRRGNQGRGRGRYQNFQGRAANIDQPRSTNNACFNCGELGHFARNCPNKKQRINLIDMDGETMYEGSSQPEDRLSRIHADLAVLSVDEKEQLAKEMGVAPAEDFRTA